MARPRKDWADLHDEVLKLRLKPEQYAKLEAIARQRDIPPAVLGRSLLIAALGEYLRTPEAA